MNKAKKVIEDAGKAYKARCLEPDADRIYQKIFDPKWTNASTSAAKYRDEIQNKVASVVRDFEEIKAMNSGFADKLREVYLDTLSMDVVRQKNEELKDFMEKPGFTNKSNENAGTVSAHEAASSETPKADEAEGTLVRIHASQDRLNQICDFMKAIGVIYEIV